jgi:citrate lyase beta subunit
MGQCWIISACRHRAGQGFVLPKAHAVTCPISLPYAGASIDADTGDAEALDPYELRRLRDQLLAVQDRILALRIGGNDLLQTMGLRRVAEPPMTGR